ncbi:cytochrome c oxidase subunit II [Nesterenkonia lutea]|uniref:cytochrome-c oxidase n=1 Tax=Nesterenkonia lutea TaxID=272919 RepID=A0ABR9JBY3_9MICC|nr:cytochrome c oxidase subunit II [Nesterenkonia lutea]MBE1523448.1 cytochrome c oxidase subunit 2 [Nesterenkonia lutea]
MKTLTRTALLLPILGVALALGGCARATERQSALNPMSPDAETIDMHWQTMLWVGAAVWAIVVGMTIATLIRRRRREAEGRRVVLFVALAGAVIPAAILVGIMAQSVWVLQKTDPGQEVAGSTITVTGHQYWWEVEYPEHGVITANEIHIPTGERVRLELGSTDVVHSVWVPELGGKMDMTPGRSTSMWLETDEPGTYWGQCAEYCGTQHALMRLVVVAHEPQEFESWLQAQGEPAVEPPAPGDDPDTIDAEDTPDQQDEDVVAQGREVFMSSSCVYCHTIAGTEAQGRAGPDLTHLASRETLAAGTLPNNPGNLAAWVVDPQAIKPGNEMPGTDLGGEELQALLAYLESLE